MIFPYRNRPVVRGILESDGRGVDSLTGDQSRSWWGPSPCMRSRTVVVLLGQTVREMSVLCENGHNRVTWVCCFISSYPQTESGKSDDITS